MTKTNTFSARLDRIKAETNGRPRPLILRRLPESDPSKPITKGFGLRQMISPMLAMGVLVGGAVSMATILSSDTSGPFDLQSAIAMNMSSSSLSTAEHGSDF
jgi:hypothetical protein